LALVFLLALQPVSGVESTQIVFVRHAETVANATGRYNNQTLNSFSAKGQRQISDLTARLVKQPRFDRILVSPSPRAMRTIAPYLSASHQRAEIWPYLYECCTGRRPKGAHATSFGWGPKITLPAEMSNLFIVRPGDDRLPNAPDYNSGLAQVQAGLKSFRAMRIRGRLLMVGHSGQGGQMIFGLTGQRRKVDNATEISFALPN
jgi:broad specificity phosphatase PhoE